MRHLLLLLVRLELSSSLLGTLVTGLGSLLTKSSVGVLGTLGQRRDLADGVDNVLVDDRESSVGLGDVLAFQDGLGVGLAGISLLNLSCTAGENDETACVLLQALDVDCESFLRKVGSASVNADADGLGVLAGDSCSLELGERETTSSTKLHVVLDGWASDSWSQLVDWARSELCGLRSTSIAARDLLAGLVEVRPDPALPILSEMVVRELLVVPDRHFDAGTCAGVDRDKCT